MPRTFQSLLLGLLAALAAPEAAALAPCAPTDCCFYDRDASGSLALAQAEVLAVGDGILSLRLLASTVYCSGGVTCPPTDFPVELITGGEGCACHDCDSLGVGAVGMFLVDLATGCVLEERGVEDGLVGCYQDDGQVPVSFALEQGLRPINLCGAAYIQADPCDGDGDGGCAQAGSGKEIAWGLVFWLAWLARRRSVKGSFPRTAGYP